MSEGKGRYPPDGSSTATQTRSLGSLNALKPYPTTRTRCNHSYRKNGAAEVHLTDIDAREPFRRISYVGMACGAHFKGLGFEGYRRAIRWLCGL